MQIRSRVKYTGLQGKVNEPNIEFNQSQSSAVLTSVKWRDVKRRGIDLRQAKI